MKNMFVVLNFNYFIMDSKVYKTYKMKKKKKKKKNALFATSALNLKLYVMSYFFVVAKLTSEL